MAAQGTYDYDSVGQRARSVVTKDGIQTTTDFTYTGLTLHKLEAEEKQGEATLAKWTITYLYDEYGRPYAGIYRDTTDPQNPAAPVTFALVTTDRGDVVELLDANGSPFAAYRYDAWGNPLGQGNAGAGIWAQATTQGEAETISLDVAEKIAGRQVLRYAGYCYDSESGMYYLSARHYDPATRQFLSKDLSRNDGEQSAYGYCLGNPVGNVDPNGLAFFDFFKRFTAKLKSARDHKLARPTKKKTTTTTRVIVFPGLPKEGRGLPDGTAYLMGVMRANAGYANERLLGDVYKRSSGLGPGLGALMGTKDTWFWYKDEVASKAPWDFKLAHDPGVDSSVDVMVFDDGRRSEKISPEDFGNMHFGFVGAQLGIPVELLLIGSWAVAKAENGLDKKSERVGEGVDWDMIQWGYELGAATPQCQWTGERYVRATP